MKVVFSFIKDRVAFKKTGWKEQLLLKGGKEVLIKSIAVAIPVLVMSCFKLPTNLWKEIKSMIANFWWGQWRKEKRLHWMSWLKMYDPKSKRELGFRDLESFSMTLLAKQGWRVLNSLDSLPRSLKAYFPSSSFLQAKLGYRSSWRWNSLFWEGKY